MSPDADLGDVEGYEPVVGEGPLAHGDVVPVVHAHRRQEDRTGPQVRDRGAQVGLGVGLALGEGPLVAAQFASANETKCLLFLYLMLNVNIKFIQKIVFCIINPTSHYLLFLIISIKN